MFHYFRSIDEQQKLFEFFSSWILEATIMYFSLHKVKCSVETQEDLCINRFADLAGETSRYVTINFFVKVTDGRIARDKDKLNEWGFEGKTSVCMCNREGCQTSVQTKILDIQTIENRKNEEMRQEHEKISSIKPCYNHKFSLVKWVASLYRHGVYCHCCHGILTSVSDDHKEYYKCLAKNIDEDACSCADSGESGGAGADSGEAGEAGVKWCKCVDPEGYERDGYESDEDHEIDYCIGNHYCMCSMCY